MKKYLLLLAGVLLLFCEKYPANPPKDPNSKQVLIDHLNTEYIETEPPVEGIVATKVNILTFQIRARNFKPKSLEFYGRALLIGPPENREQAIHFKTDSIILSPVNINVDLNTLQSIEPESTYIIKRPKYPTNEYSPFKGEQGRVQLITITEVWACDEQGKKYPVPWESDTNSNKN